jgi:uncharacterized OB-fold protein
MTGEKNVGLPSRGTTMKEDQRKKRIPVKQDLYKIPESEKDEPALVANSCRSCGEIFFPKRQICQNCQGQDLEEITLGRRGVIYSFTTVMQRPASHYRGPVPYSFGWVELPEGVRIETLFTAFNPGDLEIGLDVEMVVEKIYEDEEGNDIVCHKFRPFKR